HPEGGFVSPKEFVPVAEELGLIHELGAWVLDTVVAQMVVWRERGIAPHDIAINVSPYQLHDRSSFVDRVASVLYRTKLPAQCLVLEITESAAIVQNESMSASLAALRELGVTLA